MKTKVELVIGCLSSLLLLAADVLGQQSGSLRLTCPPDRTNWVCGVSSTAFVSYPTPTATSTSCSTPASITCSPPSGALFILGNTPVTCTATNQCGERSTCSFRVTVAQDAIPPVIQCPSNIVVLTCDRAGVEVNYVTPTATDNLDPNPGVSCTPASGKLFPVGTTTVLCTATDNCTNQSSCIFTVTVNADTTPPVIQCPSNIVLWTCSTNALTHYSVTATDDYDTDPTITCTPPLGTPLPVGDTTVTCTATDDCRNTSQCFFQVRVIRDTTPPEIQCPSNMVFNCICPDNTIVLDFFKPTVTDNHDPNPAVVCDPPSLVSSPGVHPVTCTATDNCGNSNRCSFTVTFNYDTTPPVINCPTNISVGSCSNFAVVNYAASATDACDANVELACTPSSGSVFPAGITAVVCIATDNCTNRSTCTFTVTVRPPLLYGGLCHSPLGLAALNVNTNNELEVTGFGTNGQDGVRVELGESQGLRWQMKLPTTQDGEVDGRDFLVWQRNYGQSTAGTEIQLSEVLFTFSGGRLSLTPSAASYRLTLLRNEAVVYREDGRSGAFDLPVCTPVWNEHCWENDIPEFPPNPLLPHCMWLLGQVCDIETPGGLVQADAFVVTPEDPLPPFTALTAIQILGRDVPVLTFREERLMMFRGPEQPPLPHQALGQARLVAEDGRLTLADLGTSGQDGVRIDLDGSRGLQWRMQNPPGTPEGDIDIEVFGRTTAGTEALLRRISHRYRNGQHSVTPGTGAYELKLLLRGQVAFQQGGQTGEVDIPECQPVEHEHCVGEPFAGWNPHLPYCLSFLTIECDWETPAGPVRADTLVLTPEDPVPPISSISAVRILGRNVQELPSLTLLAERVLTLGGTEFQLACPPDLTVRGCPSNSVPVTFPPPVVTGGNCTAPPIITCLPPSGSLFPPGNTTVVCTVTNICGERGVCTFIVTVNPDTNAPALECPTNLTVITCTNFAVVQYDVSATDDWDTNVALVCTPPPSSVFPVGVTSVECVARDDCGNTVRCRFDVSVRKSEVAVAGLPGGSLLSWPEGGVLEEADTVEGPWRSIPDARSPYRVDTTVGQRFFRLAVFFGFKETLSYCPSIEVTNPRLTDVLSRLHYASTHGREEFEEYEDVSEVPPTNSHPPRVPAYDPRPGPGYSWNSAVGRRLLLDIGDVGDDPEGAASHAHGSVEQQILLEVEAPTCVTPDYYVEAGDRVFSGWSEMTFQAPKNAFATKAEAEAFLLKVHAEQPFFLPFSHPDVKLGHGWYYNNGGLHRACDYSRAGVEEDEDPTFLVTSAGSGVVVATDWDGNGGNYVAVESTAPGGQKVMFIYLHLRDGKSHDIAKAKSSTSMDAKYVKYRAFANDYPDHLSWGTDSHTIKVQVGDTVSVGTPLAWAGNTGAGGAGNGLNDDGSPKNWKGNLHLHVYVAVPHPTVSDTWVWVDPYGVYQEVDTGCYDLLKDTKFSRLYAPFYPTFHGVPYEIFKFYWGYYPNMGMKLRTLSVHRDGNSLLASGSFQSGIPGGWYLHTYRTADEFQDLANQRYAQGYIMRETTVEKTLGGEPRFSAIWRPLEPGESIEHRAQLTDAQWGALWQDRVIDQKWRLEDYFGYSVDGVNYQSVFVTSHQGRPFLYSGLMTSSVFDQTIDDYKDDGFLPVSFNAANRSGSLRFSGIFRDLPGCWKVAWGLTPSGYQSYVSQQIQLGYRVWKVQGYANSDRYGVVLHDPTGPCQ